jgi:4'-phosphopantetheinyl transferase
MVTVQSLSATLNTFSPANLFLTGENVHIWLASLSQPEQLQHELRALLTVDEQERAGRFYFERDRQRYITGRGFLRLLLGAYLQADASQIRFSYTTYGKPILAGVQPIPLNFNLSHSADKILYAFTPAIQMGIDLEHVQPMPDEDHFAKLYFSARESRQLGALDGAEKTAAFFKLWTAKESYLKAVGAGLAGELNQVEVTFWPGEETRFLSLGGDPTAAQRWRLELFMPWENFQAALSIEATEIKLSIHDLI